VDAVKGAYKKRDRRYATRRSGEPHAVKRRDHRRNRRIVVVALLVCALLALVVVDYLSDGVEILQGSRVDEPTESENVERAVPSQGTADQEKAAGNPKPSVLLGEFFTDYAWDPDPGRRANLKMASEAIDGTLLAPGETFSALETLRGLDYQAAKVFASGGIDYEVGGGLCQVSSTLFMAANYSGLEIVDRNPHYAELPYIRPGFDATVWFGDESGWGALDMQFKNNTDGHILLRQFVNEDGFMIAQIYGEKPSSKQVNMESEKVEENPLRGIKWVTYKTVTDNGRVVEDGLLYETVYSYNPPTPPELKHETEEPRGAGWVDTGNTTNWNDKKN
jgi:VanW like protein